MAPLDPLLEALARRFSAAHPDAVQWSEVDLYARFLTWCRTLDLTSEQHAAVEGRP